MATARFLIFAALLGLAQSAKVKFFVSPDTDCNDDYLYGSYTEDSSPYMSCQEFNTPITAYSIVSGSTNECDIRGEVWEEWQVFNGGDCAGEYQEGHGCKPTGCRVIAAGSIDGKTNANHWQYTINTSGAGSGS